MVSVVPSPSQLTPSSPPAHSTGDKQARADQQSWQGWNPIDAAALQQHKQCHQDQQGRGEGQQPPQPGPLPHGRRSIQRSRLKVSTPIPTGRAASSGAKLLLCNGVQP